MRGSVVVAYEAHTFCVTQDRNILWKNSRNCWKAIRAFLATTQSKRINVNALKKKRFGNQQPSLIQKY